MMAVQHLQRKCACGGTPGPTGECAQCRKKRLASSLRMQPKLAVGPPGDRFEQEADQAAAAVVSGRPLPDALGLNSGSVLRRDSSASSGATGTSPTTEAPQAVDEALAQHGRPLDTAAREFMERRFGYDFGHVRVHADAAATGSARSVGARAYTVGQDVVFADGEYAPHTTAGRLLLAHELAHVIQQADGRGPGAGTGIVQRALNYVRQLTPAEAAPFLKEFDETVASMDPQVAGVGGQEGDDFRAAMARVRAMRAAGKVTLWEVAMTGRDIAFASYDPGTDELRIHSNVGRATESAVTIMHEAIHAVHAERYPRLRQLYAQVLKAGGTKDKGLGVLLLKYKAWTEYWAYRRQAELGNIVGRLCQVNVHSAAILRDDVRTSIRKVFEETQQPFDPSTWAPPTQFRAPAKPGQAQAPAAPTRSTPAGRTGGAGTETVQVDKNTSLTEFAERAGYDARCLLKLNPEVADPTSLHTGDELWLVQRQVVPAGVHTNLSDFCKAYLGNAYLWPKVWAANPHIREPVLQPTDKIRVPMELLTQPVATLSAP